MVADGDNHIEEVEDCIIKRTCKSPEYVDNCKKGYRYRYGSLSFWQAHHILPVSALKSKRINDTDDEYIEKCLCMTDWNINGSHNMMGLDTKWPYYLYPTLPLPSNLPSHLVGHDDYLKETYAYMDRNVWKKLKKKRKQHKLSPKSIIRELNSAIDYFHGELILRGKRNGGTIKCWKKRHNAGMKKIWYHPFSMSKNPRKRCPGEDIAFQPGLFNMIK